MDIKFNTNEYEEPIIEYGLREDLKPKIRSILQLGKLKEHYIDKLLDDDSMKIYNDVFTSKTADPDNNYEVYEQLGDVLAGSFIIWYMYRRFPQLKCPAGVKIVARLKINYGSRVTFFDIAEKLGFWKFITASQEEKMRRRKDLLEDTLEAFIGATAFILDNKIREGVGYAIVYDILSSIFNDINISLKYEDLYDAKTRLKEIFDHFKLDIGTVEYKCEREKKEDEIHSITTCVVNRIYQGRYYQIGIGTAAKKGDAEQKAAEIAIYNLSKLGFSKPNPESHLYENNFPSVPITVTNVQKQSPVAPNYKTRMCKNWEQGYCPRGIDCHFAHGIAELRRLKK